MEYQAGDVTFSQNLVRIYTLDGYACIGETTVTYTTAKSGDSFRRVHPMEPVVLTASQLYEAVKEYAISKGWV